MMLLTVIMKLIGSEAIKKEIGGQDSNRDINTSYGNIYQELNSSGDLPDKDIEKQIGKIKSDVGNSHPKGRIDNGQCTKLEISTPYQEILK